MGSMQGALFDPADSAWHAFPARPPGALPFNAEILLERSSGKRALKDERGSA